MYLDLYKIDGTKNLDTNPRFGSDETYPNFQEKLSEFKELLVDLVDKNESKTFYKFGDGDYFFLKGESVGSATPGRRALSKPYSQIDHQAFKDGARECDYYTCEIYPDNRQKFSEVLSGVNILGLKSLKITYLSPKNLHVTILMQPKKWSVNN